MLTIWGRANSSNLQKVVWCCEELGVSFRRIDMAGAFGFTPEYLAMNPNKVVPTIDDDGFVLWESNVIVRYLAAKHGTGTLYPAELRERAEADRWMDWQQTTLWPAMRPIFFGLIRTPEKDRDQAALAAAQRQSEHVLAIFDRYLADRVFVAGTRFTMGDIPAGIAIYRWFALPLERPDFPHVARWYRSLTERPGYRTQVMHPLT
jgi:glutathione S-transferase